MRYHRQSHNSNRTFNPFVIQEGEFKDSKLSAGYRLQWTEEGLLGEREAEMSAEKVGRNVARHKLLWLAVALMTGLSLLFARTAYLQVGNSEYYGALAESNRIRREPIPADRGIIYDRFGNKLVYNVPVFNVTVTPVDVVVYERSNPGYVEQVAALLREVLGEDAEREFNYAMIRHKELSLDSYQSQRIIDAIPHDAAVRLRIATQTLPGVSIETAARRHYVLPARSLSHIFGYTGSITQEELERTPEEYLLTDETGKAGLERQWEDDLKGEHGQTYVEVDALGQTMRVTDLRAKRDGYNLRTAIDLVLQEKIEMVLRERMAEYNVRRAAVIAMDPRSGELLAVVSLPAFNSNDFAGRIPTDVYSALIENDDRPLFNRAISGSFPTGSTFKPVVLAAALQEGVVNAQTTFNSTGGLRINQWFFPDWQAGGHGITDARRAIAWSVNTYFYHIGGGYEDFTGLGVQRITDYARLFGFSEPLGVDIPNETGGFVPSKEWKETVKGERWYVGDTYNISIGQGDLLASPLQVAAMTSFFANGGTLYRPHVVSALLNPDNTIARTVEPEVIRHDFIDPEYIRVVREGMKGTVEYGSARSLQQVDADVAGKTGTAQWSSINPNHAWFTGFAPYDNPEIVITVLLEEGEKSDHAVAVARDILTWEFAGRPNPEPAEEQEEQEE